MKPGITPPWLNEAPLGAALIDAHCIVLAANSLALEFLGTRLDHMVIPDRNLPGFREHLQHAKPFHYMIAEQGFIFTPVTMDDQQTLLWIVPSASMENDLVQMQHDLIQHRKMANLGRMMAEMAHELNNPLAGISMGCQLIGMAMHSLEAHLDGADTVVSNLIDQMSRGLARVQDATNRASKLRQELLSYGKPDSVALERHEVGALLARLIQDLSQQPPLDTLTITYEASNYPVYILCDPGKFSQILFNLFKNAYDATNGQGVVQVREFIQGGHIRLDIEDNGSGIPPDLLEKIFSPFLTTKARTGTGLGLSISQQIIHQHGGTFSVYNKPQSGACFQITLPIVQDNSVSGSLPARTHPG